MTSFGTYSFRTGGLSRSRSEGNLIDLDDGMPTGSNIFKDDTFLQDCLFGNRPNLLDSFSEVTEKTNVSKNSNPFWNDLSRSNPFLDEIFESSDNSKNNKPVPISKEDPFFLFEDAGNRQSVCSSADELDADHLLNLRNSSTKRSARWKSTSDFLDILDTREAAPVNKTFFRQSLAPDLEFLKNDREAYRKAWLNHRQLTRSCLDLGMMSQSPGWAQTQAAETQVVCKVHHHGGSVQLPDFDISVHVPEGHVAPGDVQEVTLKAILDPPQLLNNDLSATISPLLEIKLSNLTSTETISVEMKIASEVKTDPLSQVMTEIVCLCGTSKDGPFEKLQDCYIYKDTMQVKLAHLSPLMYIGAVARAQSIQPPATTVWDYINKNITVGIYGPKHIHPSFTVVSAIFGYNHAPKQLTISDLKKGKKNLPPIAFELWGKHQFLLEKPQDLKNFLSSGDPKFEVKTIDQNKIMKERELKMGKMVRQQFQCSLLSTGELTSFTMNVVLKEPNDHVVAQFSVQTPDVASKRARLPNKQRRFQKRKEVKSAPLLDTPLVKYPKFQERHVNIHSYGLAVKSVLRQPKILYLLEYFKGDTIALLGEDKVKVIGQARIKEWYVGFLRGKIGLVHCKNVKIISRHQVMDFSDVELTTKLLLEQITIPFKKLTYIYSSILAKVSEKVSDWKVFAEALGYFTLSLEDIRRKQVESEYEKVVYVLEKLKEDCHATKTKKFHHELILGLLKMDCQGLVAHLTQDTVILSTAVELGVRWRELAEKLARLTKQQIEAYEAPHRGSNGEVSLETMWKPAYDFLYTWSAHYGEGYRDVLQDLHSVLDKMKNPITKQWRHLTGALILVNCMDILRAAAFPITGIE
ncbi:metastasis-associated in colon cancer protein 1 [Latimeria chalumnae]|uniref:MET transcriptional regulator MACC1 n=1 Tax=Latimeria chalumnae TaxID=7897 RepID=H3ABX4_LATCH|nr:PREDICTED: metastasis-associated in colon cancer protein 1 [Latimeria chalumnae]|eukprot:XP_005991330.1 PREDICTED: metastasis-associated in colon cancer protein 1 [Latimeria chalumnae]